MNTPHQNYNNHDTHCDYISVSCTCIKWGETKVEFCSCFNMLTLKGDWMQMRRENKISIPPPH